MSLEAVRATLRSDSRTVLVEAPAGCGKTHEAASLALDLGKDLPASKEVLLLAHTNAAVQEFKSRVRGTKSRVRAMTLDSFALELVAPYANLLGLPSPLKVGPPTGTPFGQLAPKLADLLRRSPTITRALAAHYPTAILDEHQDARVDQHEVVRLLRVAGVGRIRVFGDPLQAIFEDRDGPTLVPWEQLASEADAHVGLSEPQRWRHDPPLGAWILQARAALLNGTPVHLHGAPSTVTCQVVPGLRDPGWPKQKKPVREVVSPLNQALTRMPGTVGVLAYTNAHVFGLRGASGRQLTIHEGADLTIVETAIAAANSHVGAPGAMSLVILDVLQETCTGLDKAKRKVIEGGIEKDRITVGKRKNSAELLSTLSKLYEQPTLRKWCSTVGEVLRDHPEWLKIDLRGSLGTIARLGECEDPIGALEHVGRARKEATRLPGRLASTIHKAKGREFDSVILPFCGPRTFPDNPSGRRLLYVALSRARRHVHFLLPDGEISPLIRHR